MRIIGYTLVLLIQVSCLAQKPVKFTSYKTDYLLDLPKGYELKKLKDDEGYREYQAVYPDGSVIYITDDEKSGGSNNAKEEKYGANVYVQILASDTLVLDGSNNDGRYWKEHKQGKIVVGYFSVPPDKKVEFDKALATLKRKKK
jgi:hypothetical protein